VGRGAHGLGLDRSYVNQYHGEHKSQFEGGHLFPPENLNSSSAGERLGHQLKNQPTNKS
jgi:hypothetical protein